LFKGKVVVIYGARQVGKTTLVREILGRYPDRGLYLNCDEPDIRDALTNRTSTELCALMGRRSLVVIDEAQRVRDIGLALKLLADNFPDLQVIATGSSSFELSNTISEPLTGRKTEFHLYPLSAAELLTQETPLEATRLLEHRLRYGMYPGVVVADDPGETVLEIAASYLYRDVLEYQSVKSPDLLRRLLQALALQVGGEGGRFRMQSQSPTRWPSRWGVRSRTTSWPGCWASTGPPWNATSHCWRKRSSSSTCRLLAATCAKSWPSCARCTSTTWASATR